MRHTIVFVLTALLIASAASAQTEAPAAPAAQAAPGTAPALTPAQQANRDRIKGERQTCRTDAQGKGLKGPALQAAVQDCMSKVDPVAAKRGKCFMAAKAQNLIGADRQKSVRECMKSS